MAKRGLSWKKSGALRMAEVLQLRANGEIRPYCERRSPVERGVSVGRKHHFSNFNGQQTWLEAGLPALVGPHASRSWVKKLRHMTNLNYRLN